MPKSSANENVLSSHFPVQGHGYAAILSSADYAWLDQNMAALQRNATSSSHFIRRAEVVATLGFALLYQLIALRFILLLAGSHASDGWRSMIETVSAPLVAPFNHLLDLPLPEPATSLLGIGMALLVFGLLHFGIVQTLRSADE